MDHRVPNATAIFARTNSYRKRVPSATHPRKRDRHDLICVVCHAPAMGYNFDQITCESCKAFFRRNALSNAGKFKCRSSHNDCIITLETRKRCKACRLKKCFEKGLRKEWIMSEEEKRHKRQKIEDNRRLRALSRNLSLSLTPTSSPSIVPETEGFPYSMETSTNFDDDGDDDDEENETQFDSSSQDTNHEESVQDSAIELKNLFTSNDRLLLTALENNYDQAIRWTTPLIKDSHTSSLRILSKPIDLINELIQTSTLRMITFLKLTPEFSSLHEDDRLVLVKHNLAAVFFFHLCICTNLTAEIYQEPHGHREFSYQIENLRLLSDELYQNSIKFVEDVQREFGSDSLLIKLMILIVIFAKGSDLDEPIWLQTEQIFHAQNHFVELLWKYFQIRYPSVETAMKYSRCIFSCLKAQQLGRQLKRIVTQCNVDSQQLAPLMQSVLLLS